MRPTGRMIRTILFGLPIVMSLAPGRAVAQQFKVAIWYDRANAYAEGRAAMAYSHSLLANLFELNDKSPAYRLTGYLPHPTALSGRPIVPLSLQLSRKFRAKSWDRFQVPLPFSTCEINVGQPLRVPRDISDEARQKLRLQLEASLKELSWD